MTINPGQLISDIACYGMCAEPLTQDERAAIVEYIAHFEECDEDREALAAMTDARLCEYGYHVMAEYASGQM